MRSKSGYFVGFFFYWRPVLFLSISLAQLLAGRFFLLSQETLHVRILFCTEEHKTEEGKFLGKSLDSPVAPVSGAAQERLGCYQPSLDFCVHKFWCHQQLLSFCLSCLIDWWHLQVWTLSPVSSDSVFALWTSSNCQSRGHTRHF